MTARASLVIATRKSKLALWQAEHVAAGLRAAHPGLEVELLAMSTKGDQIQDRSLAAIGGKGLFIKELEAALDDGRADLAVHSMKDVPSELPPGMMLAAMLTRADPRDALIARRGCSLAELPPGARLGTSSLRRRAQLLASRPDLDIQTLRGNVDTRLRRLEEGDLDAIVLAAAGLARLGLESRISALLDPSVSLPAVGQGVIGIECRSDDAAARKAVRVLDDAAAHAAVSAERAFARRLGGSCQSPIAAFAEFAAAGRPAAERLELRGLVAEPDGSRVIKDSLAGPAAEAEEIGERLAERLLAAGAGELLERLRDG
ncbi:MAG TPA: hydroxymethylbilane synthase [Steroidobacteraceae bacterium]|jgi:hydroxymethylbilane synthase|nr:hydroxymethylbilane synthase [Steroidobacteraceae bacterium]